jgi:uroporphyrin-III C-methyltransferase
MDKLTNIELKSNIYLVGCGLGSIDLLTIRAYKIIQNVDVLLYDHLISDEILSIIPDSSKKVFVGKQKGFHSKSQDEINGLILEYAKDGYTVARLKSGDPYIYGRGAEEAIYLIENGFSVEVVAGISSAISAPLEAGIPITTRGYSDSVTVVSAHLRGNRVNLNWIELLKRENHTIVALMAISRANEISKHAIALGVDENKKVAIISNASREDQETKISTIKDLPKDSIGAKRPAILVFGDVVELSYMLKGNI